MRRVLVLLIAVAVILPFIVSAGTISLAVFVLIAAIGAQGINVVTGYAGQLSFGHAFFLGLGAYVVGYLGGDLGWSAFLWLPVAGLFAALIGALIAPTAVRLRGLYLSIVTIALVVVGQYLFLNAGDLTGGPAGRAIPSLRFGSFDLSMGQELAIGPVLLDRDQLYYYVCLVLLLVATVYVYNLSRSRVGRAMFAIHHGELGAAVLGVNATRTKVTAFAISAFMGGTAGALYGSYLSFVQPEQWSLMFSVQFLAAMVIGGAGTVLGPILGSVVVFALPNLIEQLPWFDPGSGGPSAGSISAITYAVIVIVVLTRYPRGLIGLVEAVKARAARP